VNKARITICALFVSLATTVASAAPHPFYMRMLERGIADANRGNYAAAVQQLRTASFGLLDELPQYQTAQVHLAVAYEKLGKSNESRLAATKFLQAERLSQAYATLSLDAATRATFEKVVASAVEPAYLASIPSFRRPAPQAVTAVASTQPVLPKTTTAGNDAASQLEVAQQLLDQGKILAARTAFWKISERRDLTRAQVLDVARGLNRGGAWLESATVYQRAQPFVAGDEQHMFYEAINRYELGEVSLARTLLARASAALPKTREVTLYRAKIQAGR
jgi:hypothetical protein